MRFLADESCDFSVVRALREAGHDVTAIVEINPGINDEVVIALAHSESRVLLTEDKDFGQLAYAGDQGARRRPDSFSEQFSELSWRSRRQDRGRTRRTIGGRIRRS